MTMHFSQVTVEPVYRGTPLCGQRGHVSCTNTSGDVSCKRCLKLLGELPYAVGVDVAKDNDKTVMTVVKREPDGRQTVVDQREFSDLGLRMLAKEHRVRVLRHTQHTADDSGFSKQLLRTDVLFKGSAAAFAIWRRTHHYDPNTDLTEHAQVQQVHVTNRHGDALVRNHAFEDINWPHVYGRDAAPYRV